MRTRLQINIIFCLFTKYLRTVSSLHLYLQISSLLIQSRNQPIFLDIFDRVFNRMQDRCHNLGDPAKRRLECIFGRLFGMRFTAGVALLQSSFHDKYSIIISEMKFKELYLKTWIRLPVKMAISIVLVKPVFDFYHFMLDNENFLTLKPPRHTFFLTKGAGSIPQLPAPYAFYESFHEYLNLRHYYRVRNQLLYIMSEERFKAKELIPDHPLRENPNYIDHAIELGQTYRYSEYILYHVLEKYARENNGVLPKGAFRQIRQREQIHLEFMRPIIPKL